MEFKVKATDLYRAMQQVHKVIPRRTPMEVLHNFHIQAIGTNVLISATDLEMSLIKTIKAKTAVNLGSILLPIAAEKVLATALDGWVHITCVKNISDVGEDEITVVTSKGTYSYPAVPVNQYPLIKMVVDADSFLDLGKDTFLDGFSRTVCFTSNDELRPQLTGVNVSNNNGGVRFCSTDGHRMGIYRVDAALDSQDLLCGVTIGAMGNFTVIVPATAINVLLSLIKGNKNLYTIKMGIGKGLAYFDLDDVTLVTKLIEGNFVNYKAVLPANNTNVLKVIPQQVLDVISRIEVFTNPEVPQLVLKLEFGNIRICSRGGNTEVEEVLVGDYVGDDKQVGFDLNYVRDMMAVFKKPIFWKFGSASLATTIEDVDSGPLFCVLMPVRL